MTRGRRRLLFYCLILIFVCLGTLVLLYAQGWRMDLASFKISRVGAIFVRSFPANTKVNLDGQPISNQRGFFESGTLISNLYPKSYILSLAAPGYQTWNENLTVQPSLVTEAKYAVLLPNQPTIVSAGPMLNFWLIKDQLAILDTKHILIALGHKLPGEEVVDWNSDATRILTRNAKNHFLTNLAASTTLNLTNALSQIGYTLTSSSSIRLNPVNSSSIILQGPTRLALWNISGGILHAIATSTSPNLSLVAVSPTTLAWTRWDDKNKTSELNLYDQALGTLSLSAQTLPDQNVKIAWSSRGTLGLGQANGDFFLYNLGQDKLTKIASDARDFAFSPDGRILATLEHNSLEVFSLVTAGDYWRFSLPDANKIKSIVWYKDARHILVTYPDAVKFLDLDDAAQINYLTVATTTRSFYDFQNNQFYFLNGGAILQLDFPS